MELNTTAPKNKTERVPPQNIEAEMCALGSMLLDPDACGLGLEILKADDFYLPAHKFIFEEIVELYDASKPTDMVLLRENLKKKGLLEKVGGTEYLASVMESVPTSANAAYYANIVQDKGILRRLIEKTNDIQREAYEAARPAKDILEAGEAGIFSISQDKFVSSDIEMSKIVNRAVNFILEEHSGLETGFHLLDDKTNGFQSGQLIVIAGRPGMGKTTFALSVMQNVARNGNPVAFFSLEMPSEQVVRNMIAGRAKIDSRTLNRGGKVITDEYHAKIMKAAGELYEMPIFIDDNPTLSPLSLKARARRLKSQHDVSMIVIDYLQLMEAPGHSSESRQQEISYISRSLKALARELDVPVISLCQLSRAPEAREDKKPRLSDLRESGAIEQDADIVLLLFRPEYYFPEKEELAGIAEVNLAKHRNGETGTINVSFISKFMRFENREVFITDENIPSDLAR